MKIISPFHDYYDSVLKTQIEDSPVIFQRKQLEFSVKDIDKSNKTHIINQLWEQCYDSIMRFRNTALSNVTTQSLINNNKNYSLQEIERGIVIFCGKAYKYLKLTKTSLYDIPSISYIYSFNDFEKYLNENKISYKEKVYSTKNVKSFFKIYFDPLIIDIDFLIENKITIAVINTSNIYINCSLNTFQFYRVFDAFRTYQELDMWLSGTLSYPQNIMIEVSNSAKIEKAGFDTRYSFRHRPKH